MLKLITPITIGSQTYDLLIPGKGEWDLRARRINFILTLAQEEQSRLRIAREMDTPDGGKLLAPAPVLSLQVQDRDEDPVINAVIQKFTTALEALEQFIESQLGDQVYLLGEDELSLEATFETSTKEYKNERPARTDPAPAEGERQ